MSERMRGDRVTFSSLSGDVYDAIIAELHVDDKVVLDVIVPSANSSTVRLTCRPGADGVFTLYPIRR